MNDDSSSRFLEIDSGTKQDLRTLAHGSRRPGRLSLRASLVALATSSALATAGRVGEHFAGRLLGYVDASPSAVRQLPVKMFPFQTGFSRIAMLASSDCNGF
jgi:hypothetical protein